MDLFAAYGLNITKKITHHINKISNLNKKITKQVKRDLKNITSKRESILGFNFNDTVKTSWYVIV